MTTGGHYDSPHAPPPPPPPMAAPTAARVEHDISCRKCGYNLRGLSVEGRCPECGSAVGLSLQGDLLRYSEPAWVDGLRRGISLIIAGIAVMVLAVIASVLLNGGRAAPTPRTLLVSQLGGIVFAVLNLIGTWLLTERDPSGLGEDQYGTSRKIIRVALIVGLIEQAKEMAATHLGFSPPARAMMGLISVVAAIFSVVGLFATLNYLRKLALRIPDTALSNRAQFLTYAFGTTYGLLAVGGAILAAVVLQGGGGAPTGALPLACAMGIVGLAVLVFAVMYLFMLDRLRRRFAEQAEFARQTWAAGNR